MRNKWKRSKCANLGWEFLLALARERGRAGCEDLEWFHEPNVMAVVVIGFFSQQIICINLNESRDHNRKRYLVECD